MSLIADALRTAAQERASHTPSKATVRRRLAAPRSSLAEGEWFRPAGRRVSQRLAVAAGLFAVALGVAGVVVAITPWGGAHAHDLASGWLPVSAGPANSPPPQEEQPGAPPVPLAPVAPASEAASAMPIARFPAMDPARERAVESASLLPGRAPAPEPAPANALPPPVQDAPVAEERASRQPPPASGAFQLTVDAAPRRSAGDLSRAAVAAQRRGDYPAAVALLRQALAEDDKNAELHNQLGIAYQVMGALANARDAFRQALVLQPELVAAWSNLGGVLLSLGADAEAEATLAEATRRDPRNVGAKVNLAILYGRQGLTAEARGLLEAAVSADPSLAEAHYALAQLLDAQGDRPGAARHFQLFLTTGAGSFPHLEAAVRQRLTRLSGGSHDS